MLHGPFAESGARFSPDGRWVAYESNESGPTEIYVQSFPLSGAKWQVSTAGGTLPQWRQDGKELLYLADGRLMSVPVQASPTFTPGTPTPLFQVPLLNMQNAPRYGVSPDGQRFLFNVAAQGQAASQRRSPCVLGRGTRRGSLSWSIS